MRGWSWSVVGTGHALFTAIRSAVLLSAVGSSAVAAAGGCPIGYQRTSLLVFSCGRQRGEVQVLIARASPLLVDMPTGVRGLELELQAPYGGRLAVLDTSTGVELANTSGGAAAAVWRGVRIETHLSPLRAALVGSLPSPLLAVFAGATGGGSVANLKFGYADFDHCPAVPVGCAPFEREKARDMVVRWSRWASSRFASPEAAWDALCLQLASQASPPGAVPFSLWRGVWAQWPKPAGAPSGWQAAFKFIDQRPGTLEDGRVDHADFRAAFRLASVASAVSTWCQRLRNSLSQASAQDAWAATGGASDTTHGGLTFGTWESQVWAGQGSSAEETFAYIDTDGDNVISSVEFAKTYQTCGAPAGSSGSGPPVGGVGGAVQNGSPVAAGGARCFAYRPEEFGTGGAVASAFGDVVAQQWSLFLLDDFSTQDPFTWEMPSGGASWSDGQVRFSGGGRSIRTVAALYRNTGTIVIRVAMTKVGLCDNHFLMLSRSAAEQWSWRPSSSSVKFAWSCGSKYIISRKASASTACSAVGRYVVSITLDPAGAMEFQDDRGCRDLVLQDNLGANGEPLYLYIGGDGPPGNSSAFDNVSVQIGINNIRNSRAGFPTATACLYDGAQYEGPTREGGHTTEPSIAACQLRCARTPGCARFSFRLWSHSCDLYDGGAAWHRSPGVISGPPRCMVGVEMQVSGVNSAPLTLAQKSDLAPRLAEELAKAASLPTTAVKDAGGTAERVSIARSGLLACGFVNLPAGQSLAGIASRLAGGTLEERIQSSLSASGISGALRGTGSQDAPHLQTSVWALPAAQCLLLHTAYGPSMPSEGLLVVDDLSACQARCVRVPGCAKFTFRRQSRSCHLHNASARASWDEGAVAGPRVCAALPSVLEAGPRAAALASLTEDRGWALFWWALSGLLLLGLMGAAAAALVLHPQSPLAEWRAQEGCGMYRPLSVQEEAPPSGGGCEMAASAFRTVPMHDVASDRATEPRDSISEAMTTSSRQSRASQDDAAGPVRSAVPSREETSSTPGPARSDSGLQRAGADHQGHGNTRPRHVSAVFQALDKRGRGRLGRDELRHYAEYCGFDGSDEDWVEEYRSMAAANGWSEALGMDEEQFRRLVDDVDGKGYCTDDELTGLLEELKSGELARHDSLDSYASST